MENINMRGVVPNKGKKIELNTMPKNNTKIEDTTNKNTDATSNNIGGNSNQVKIDNSGITIHNHIYTGGVGSPEVNASAPTNKPEVKKDGDEADKTKGKDTTVEPKTAVPEKTAVIKTEDEKKTEPKGGPDKKPEFLIEKGGVNPFRAQVKDLEDKINGLGLLNNPEDKKEIERLGKELVSIKEKEMAYAEQRVENARNKYLVEYEKCRSELSRQALIQKTKNSILNIFKSKENKKYFKEEEFFTKELKDLKADYNKARIEKGNSMYEQHRSELKSMGLTGAELEKALAEYKSTEILKQTILDERQKLIDSKVPNPAMWKKLLNGYLKLPRWQRIALSTVLFLPAAAAGTFGAAFVGYGALGWGALAGTKFAMSMAMGTAVGHTTKAIDWAKKGSDEKFKKGQDDQRNILKEKFSKNEIGQEEYEKGIEAIEKEEHIRNRNRTLLKAGVGMAIAGAGGYFAYDALGHGIPHPTGASTGTVDAVSGPDAHSIGVPHVVPPVHESVNAVADHGQGGISTIRELQHNLKAEYGNNLDNAPASVKHIMGTDANKLAQEYGMYKPGQVDESAMMKSGSYIRVDGNGNVIYHEAGSTNGDVILEKGTDINASDTYHGKMFDAHHHTGTNTTESNSMQETINNRPPLATGPVEGHNLSNFEKNNPQVDPTIGKGINTTSSDSNLSNFQKNTPQVDPTNIKAVPIEHNSVSALEGTYWTNQSQIPTQYFLDFNNAIHGPNPISSNMLSEMLSKGTVIDHPTYSALGEVIHHYSLKGSAELLQTKEYAGSLGINTNPLNGEPMADYVHRIQYRINSYQQNYNYNNSNTNTIYPSGYGENYYNNHQPISRPVAMTDRDYRGGDGSRGMHYERNNRIMDHVLNSVTRSIFRPRR